MTKKQTAPVQWQNRIIGYTTKRADQLTHNPNNPRRHPEKQRKAVKGSLDTLGWIAPVIENVRTGYLIDGHERCWQALQSGDDTPIPVIQVDLDEAEEAQALATFDFITYMAEYDKDILNDVLRSFNSDNADIQALVGDMVSFDFLNDSPFNEKKEEEKQASDGSLLALTNITIDDPLHTVQQGQIYILSNKHYLICAEVITQWAIWKPFLKEDAIFCPYPGVFVPLSQKANESILVMVQPDTYICGHILDRYTEHHPDSIKLLEVK